MSITGSEQWMYSAGGEFYNFPIEQSLRFNDNDSAYLSRTPSSSGNLDAWTFSCWVKRGNLGVGTQTLFGASSDVNNWMYIGFTSGNTLTWTQADGGSVTATVTTSQVFRDVSSFYHIQCTYDSAEATAADRMRVYINGERVTAFGSASYLAQNADSRINRNIGHTVGRLPYSAAGYFDGYMADVNFVDGTAYDASSFGETKSGIWISKDTADLTFGTNGFRLEYGDSAAIGDDTSGNTNDWTVNNLVASDVVLDSPTNNFGIMSSIDKGDGTATYSEGNLKVSVGDNEEAFGSFGMSSGKWYWEIRYVSSAASNNKIGLGIADTATPNNNEVTNNGHQGTTYAPNDILAVAVDVDNETFSFYKNGSIIETDTDWSAKGWASIKPIVTSSNSSGEEVCILNFGQDDTFAGAISATGNTDGNGQGVFKYTPPSGFLALCSANLPSGAIDTLADETPEDYFNTVLYTGTGANNSITGVGFQTDFLWLKQRNAVDNHVLFDVVRGGPSNELYANLTNAEAASTGALISYDSDGFTLGASGDLGRYNENGSTYAAWNWKAGGSGVSNPDGSITSTVSVGATSQQNWFSIVGYQGNGTAGATVGHGLGVTPDLLIMRRRSPAEAWPVWVGGAGFSATEYLRLNGTNAKDTATSLFNSTLPTSSVVTLGNGNFVNTNASDYIMYAFANAEGLCKAGSYTGNGSSDGTFINIGFRPAFVLTKKSSASGEWVMWDNRRSGYNVDNDFLYANASNSEYNGASYPRLDLVSNGFKMRDNSADTNGSGATYIYLAIAEQPFAFANAR